MTEMEMLKELRNVVASIAGQAGGNREAVKAEIRQELVSAVKERFGLGICRGIHDGPGLRQVQPGRPDEVPAFHRHRLRRDGPCLGMPALRDRRGGHPG